MYVRTFNSTKEVSMNKYKIETGGISYMMKSNQTKARLLTDPALFFLCKGEYQVQKCGQITAIKQLKSHLKTIIKKMGINNEA